MYVYIYIYIHTYISISNLSFLSKTLERLVSLFLNLKSLDYFQNTDQVLELGLLIAVAPCYRYSSSATFTESTLKVAVMVAPLLFKLHFSAIRYRYFKKMN